MKVCHLISAYRQQKQSSRGVFIGKNPKRNVISIKSQSNFNEIILGYGCSLVNSLHIFRAPFLMSTSGELPLRHEGKLGMQKQPTRGVPRKKCSENMQQIYRRTLMPKCNFNRVSRQFYKNHTLAWVFSCKFCCIFSEHLWLLLSMACCS